MGITLFLEDVAPGRILMSQGMAPYHAHVVSRFSGLSKQNPSPPPPSPPPRELGGDILGTVMSDTPLG